MLDRWVHASFSPVLEWQMRDGGGCAVATREKTAVWVPAWHYTYCLMRLSVAFNLIPKGVRMITWGWIISHRCSWITVYVSCCNAHTKYHSSHHVMLSTMVQPLFCQLPSCNLFTQHVTYLIGETPLVNCGPRSFLNHDNTNNCNSMFFFIHCKQTPFSAPCT